MENNNSTPSRFSQHGKSRRFFYIVQFPYLSIRSQSMVFVSKKINKQSSTINLKIIRYASHYLGIPFEFNGFLSKINGFHRKTNGTFNTIDGFPPQINGFLLPFEKLKKNMNFFNQLMDSHRFHQQTTGFPSKIDGFHLKINGCPFGNQLKS